MKYFHGDPVEAVLFCQKVADHYLEGWKVKLTWDGWEEPEFMKRADMATVHEEKVIVISTRYFDKWSRRWQFIAQFKHEVAHALLSSNEGHSNRWKTKYIELMRDGKFTSGPLEAPADIFAYIDQENAQQGLDCSRA